MLVGEGLLNTHMRYRIDMDLYANDNSLNKYTYAHNKLTFGHLVNINYNDGVNNTFL